MSNDTNKALFDYLLRLGDDRLIIGHRISEWCGHGPIMEEDLALQNIALDLIGQAQAFLKYAGEVEGKGRSEDDLAYFRDEMDFRNSLISEQPNGDFGNTMVRQLFYDAYDYLLLSELKNSKNETLSALAAKSLKESTYHLRHSSEWVIRLGDGTEESHERVQTAVNDLWMYTGDMFASTVGDNFLKDEGILPDLSPLRTKWLEMIKSVMVKATLTLPDEKAFMQFGSRDGIHTEHLGYILSEMQYLNRRYPDAKW